MFYNDLFTCVLVYFLLTQLNGDISNKIRSE